MFYGEIKTDWFAIKREKFSPCELDSFRIKGKSASADDFGESRDTGHKDPEEWEPVCVNRKFFPFSKPAKAVLEKYGITSTEWREVAKALKKALNVGECSWCL